MKNINTTLKILALAIIFSACTGSASKQKKQSENTPQVSDKSPGKELFRLNCAGCHGIDRKGNPPTYPSLINIKDKLTYDEVRTQIKNGKGKMPPMAHLSDVEIDAILGYLYGEKEPGKTIEWVTLTPAEHGKMLFQSNCSGCHRAKPSDPQPQNAGTKMCSMMIPATLGGVDNRYTRDEFIAVLDAGPCYMPSFAFLNKQDKQALYDYLKSLELEWQSGREHPMGMEHPEHPGNMEHPSGREKQQLTIEEFADAAEAYIREKTKKNGGFFPVRDKEQNKTLQLTLKKVHRKRLSYLGGKTYFVCANFKGKDGNLYDIDIFMQGMKKSNLKEAKVPIVHKVNGEPRFTWDKENGVWKQSPAGEQKKKRKKEHPEHPNR